MSSRDATVLVIAAQLLLTGCSDQRPGYDAECLAIDAGNSTAGSCLEWEAAIRSKCDGGLANADAGSVNVRWLEPSGTWDCELFATLNCPPGTGNVCQKSASMCLSALNAASSCSEALSAPCTLICVN